MKIIIDNAEIWIKDNIKLPPNFDSMDSSDKRNYICSNKLLHRENGPAEIYFEGSKYWYLNGLLHREDGPAMFWHSGYQHWYLNDLLVDGEIYQKIQNSSKEELLVYMINLNYKDYLPLIEYRLNL